MTEKRKHKRINVEGKIDGKVVLASMIQVHNLSLGGVHFTCTKRVATNSTCTIHLKFNDQNITLSGNVVRSVFRGTKKIKNESVPLYEVAMEFRNLNAGKTEILRSIIDFLDT